MGTSSDQKKWLRILAVFAHPDDETFCAGGTLARYVAQGAEAMVVSATRGDAGQIRDARVATRRTLGQTRERELHAACERLGVQHAQCLDYHDGTLQNVDRRELAESVVRIMRAFRPDVVITFGPDGAYGHPDHIAIGEAATLAFQWAADPQQLSEGLTPHAATRLYHSYFPAQRTLLFEQLVQWLHERALPFEPSVDFVHALLVFAEEATCLRYSGDHIDVQWFPQGFYIVEQGEPATKLYVLLSGQAQVVSEDADGRLTTLARLAPGQFFGEQELASGTPRQAHVVAVENATCLVFSPSAPTEFAGRGAGAQGLEASPEAAAPASAGGPANAATTCIDVSAYVRQKINALSAHRTQYPIEPDMFPLPLLNQIFGREYFVRVYPPIERETSLYSVAEMLQIRMSQP